MSQVKNTYESKVNELTKWVAIKVFLTPFSRPLLRGGTVGQDVKIFILVTFNIISLSSELLKTLSEKESMMEYVYQYDNLQRQLQLLQWVSPLQEKTCFENRKITKTSQEEGGVEEYYSKTHIFMLGCQICTATVIQLSQKKCVCKKLINSSHFSSVKSHGWHQVNEKLFPLRIFLSQNHL